MVKKTIVKLATLPFEAFDFKALRRRKDSMGELCVALLNRRGEASAMAIGREIIDRFEQGDDGQRLEFFNFLLHEFGHQFDDIDRAIEMYLAHPGQTAARDLASSLKTTRRSFFQVLNATPGGTQAIIGMRAALGPLLKDEPELELVDKDIAILLENWFNRGFLELREICWNTPALILEKLIEYEAVHEIQGWDDLRRRLASDRRCFAFFHPAMPNEPLIFVEVALLPDMASSIQSVLEQAAPADLEEYKPSTAIFYSISNCQDGLRGITFGNFLIKQVVEELARQFPNLRQFATLSPIPGFARWLKQALSGTQLEWLPNADRDTLAGLLQREDWHNEPSACQSLEPLLRKLTSYYFLHAKYKQTAKPYDPVARFHLGNGARLERINFLGDTSAKGLQQSHGLLVNYLYDAKSLASNHEAYANNDEIKCSNDVLQPVKKISA